MKEHETHRHESFKKTTRSRNVNSRLPCCTSQVGQTRLHMCFAAYSEGSLACQKAAAAAKYKVHALLASHRLASTCSPCPACSTSRAALAPMDGPVTTLTGLRAVAGSVAPAALGEAQAGQVGAGTGGVEASAVRRVTQLRATLDHQLCRLQVARVRLVRHGGGGAVRKDLDAGLWRTERADENAAAQVAPPFHRHAEPRVA